MLSALVIPRLIEEAFAADRWRDPGPSALKELLGLAEAESDLELCESRAAIEHLTYQVEAGGYLQDPVFCMVRTASELAGADDPRLVYESAVFVGASLWPGDDVFLAVDVSKRTADQHVLWFDWSHEGPGRWKPVARLSAFVACLAARATK